VPTQLDRNSLALSTLWNRRSLGPSRNFEKRWAAVLGSSDIDPKFYFAFGKPAPDAQGGEAFGSA